MSLLDKLKSRNHRTTINLLMAVLIVSFLLFVPIIAVFTSIGSKVIFNVFAADSMYYMAIANNFIKFGFPSMAGETMCNGFHPLWEWLLMVTLKVSGLTHHYQIYLVFALSAFLVSCAYIIVSYAFISTLGRWAGIIATLALFPGAYGLFIEPRRFAYTDPGILYTLSPQSAINGMETPLSLVLWAIIFFILTRRLHFLTNKEQPSLDINMLFPDAFRYCLPALILCRLDDVFILISIGLFILLQHQISFWNKIKAVFHITWPTALALVLYLAYNWYSVGVFLPTSAVSKMTYLAQKQQDRILDVISGNMFASWWIFAVRFLPSLCAIIVGVYCMYTGWPQRNINVLSPKNPFKILLFLLGPFLIIKGLFIILFIPLLQQGYWHYFSMIMICNIMFATMVGTFVRDHRRHIPGAFLLLSAIILFRMPNDINLMSNSGSYGEDSYALWKNEEQIKSFLHIAVPDAKLVDTLDGMFAYLLDMPSESATGLASSPQELERRKEIGLWKSLASRRYSLLPDRGYINPSNYPPDVRILDTLQLPGTDIYMYRVEISQ